MEGFSTGRETAKLVLKSPTGFCLKVAGFSIAAD
jgi:hypothetical protein